MTWPQHERQQCTVDGHPIHLTPTERDILACLLMGSGRLTTLVSLIEYLWPFPDDEPDTADNLVRVMVCRLRNKGVPITSRHGRGYFVGHQPLL